tara:strand:- start:1174 stop:1566 length:393 start_codon:yes stop_codon:yes gene_type:complete
MQTFEILAHFIDLIHVLLIFFPVIVYFIPFKKYIVKIMFLFSALTPLGWIIFDNKCWVTMLVSSIMDPDNKKTEYQKSFSERYLAWFYYFFLDLFGKEHNAKNMDWIVALHWVINIILIWYYVFIRNCSC